MKTATTKETPEQLLIPLEFSRFSNEPKAAAAKAEALRFSIERPRNPKTGEEMKQPRFANRKVIKPNIDLGDYKTKALIDWIQVEVVLNKKSQSRWVSKRLGAVLGKNPRVTEKGVPYYKNGNSYYTGQEFWIKMEEPTRKSLKALQLYLEDQCISYEATKIIGIELSLDFYPKDLSDQRRWEMVSALRLTHNPKNFKMNGNKDCLRQVFAKDPDPDPEQGKTKTEYIIPKTGKIAQVDTFGDDSLADFFKMLDALDTTDEVPEVLGDHEVKDKDTQRRILDFRKHKTPFVDATVYLGERDAEVMFRYQNKTADNRTVDGGETEQLNQADKRARLEVTLLDDELKKIGLNSVADLIGFNFKKLGSRYFRFSLPLIHPDQKDEMYQHGPKNVQNALQAIRGRFTRDTFCKSGMYGAKYRQEVLRQRRKELRQLRSKSGEKLETVMSKKIQSQDSLQWSEMNTAVYEAFKGLSKRWGG